MNTFYFTAFLLLMNFTTVKISIGQNYYPLLNDSMTWDAHDFEYSLPACSQTGAIRVFVHGDTVINTLSYHRISGYHA